MKKNLGFTLIEMLIALSIFSVLVISAIGITLEVVSAQRHVAGIQALQDNLRFSLELMTREMRTGAVFELTTDCVGPPEVGKEISFWNFNRNPAEQRIYYMNDTDGDGSTDTLMRVADSSDCANKSLPFTANEIIIDQFNIQLRGEVVGPNDGQPVITISLHARSRAPEIAQESSLYLQTTITQRFRDIF